MDIERFLPINTTEKVDDIIEFIKQNYSELGPARILTIRLAITKVKLQIYFNERYNTLCKQMPPRAKRKRIDKTPHVLIPRRAKKKANTQHTPQATAKVYKYREYSYVTIDSFAPKPTVPRKDAIKYSVKKTSETQDKNQRKAIHKRLLEGFGPSRQMREAVELEKKRKGIGPAAKIIYIPAGGQNKRH